MIEIIFMLIILCCVIVFILNDINKNNMKCPICGNQLKKQKIGIGKYHSHLGEIFDCNIYKNICIRCNYASKEY